MSEVMPEQTSRHMQHDAQSEDCHSSIYLPLCLCFVLLIVCHRSRSFPLLFVFYVSPSFVFCRVVAALASTCLKSQNG